MNTVDPLCTEMHIKITNFHQGTCVRNYIPWVKNLWCAVERGLKMPPQAIPTQKVGRGKTVRWGSKLTGKEENQERLRIRVSKRRECQMPQTSQRRYNMSIDFGHQRSLVTLIRSISVEWYGGKEAGVLGIT